MKPSEVLTTNSELSAKAMQGRVEKTADEVETGAAAVVPNERALKRRAEGLVRLKRKRLRRFLATNRLLLNIIVGGITLTIAVGGGLMYLFWELARSRTEPNGVLLGVCVVLFGLWLPIRKIRKALRKRHKAGESVREAEELAVVATQRLVEQAQSGVDLQAGLALFDASDAAKAGHLAMAHGEGQLTVSSESAEDDDPRRR